MKDLTVPAAMESTRQKEKSSLRWSRTKRQSTRRQSSLSPALQRSVWGCHETIEKGGMGIAAVSASHSHPFNVSPNAKVATVPDAFLREGKLECVGCHDPHPSNPNFKYLRVDTSKGAKMGDFCAMCHSSKADPSASKSMKIFKSMDERNTTAAPAAAPAPAEPAKK